MLELNLCIVEDGGRDRAGDLYKYIPSPGGPNAFTQVPASLLKITCTAGGKRLGFSSVCVGEGSCAVGDRKTQRWGWVERGGHLKVPAFGFCPAQNIRHPKNKGQCCEVWQNGDSLGFKTQKRKKKNKQPSPVLEFEKRKK